MISKKMIDQIVDDERRKQKHDMSKEKKQNLKLTKSTQHDRKTGANVTKLISYNLTLRY